MIIGIVTEYNPFHFGHLYQIRHLKEKYHTPIVICMSGNTVQRGTFSLLNKQDKTKIALNYGIDLVTELPAAFVFQSAKNYAFAAIDTLSKVNITHLAFGIEGDFSVLDQIADFQMTHEEIISQHIRTKQTNYHHAMLEVLTELGFPDLSFKSNDILALEYIKHLKKYFPHITPIPIPRIGSDYRDPSLNQNKINSATAIRNAYVKKQNIQPFVPDKTFHCLKQRNAFPPNDQLLYQILFYKTIIQEDPFEHITGFERGLDERLRDTINGTKNLNQWLEKASTRRYRPQRIRRFLGNYIFNITTEIIDSFLGEIPYVNVLGFNRTGKEILAKAKKNTTLITNFKNCHALSLSEKNLYQYHIKISQFYYQKKNVPDFHAFPIIKDSSF